MRYSMMQLSLAHRNEGTIFSGLAPQFPRQRYIQQAFANEIRFEYWKQDYIFKPFASPDSSFVIGVIGKERRVTVAGPPEQEFATHEVEDWDTANVLIDTQAYEQKVAMQDNLGSPINIFRALIDQINRGAHAEWSLAVHPIIEREQFWATAERYRGHIKELDLNFEVPNIWGGESETEKALRELRDNNNAQEVGIKIKNRDGRLNPDSPNVRESIEYISKGGGSVKLRDDEERTVYNSDQEDSVVTVPIDPDFKIQGADEGLIMSLVRRLFP